MKNLTSSTILLAFFLYLSPALALDFETRVLIDKTFVHDNTYCQLGGKKLEIEIRSFEKYTHQKDLEYGDHVIVIQDKKYISLPINETLIGRFKLLKGKDKNCSKALSIKLDNSKLIFFLLKDNRPLKSSLLTVLYNLETQKSIASETEFNTEDGFIEDGVLKFSSSETQLSSSLGNVKIRNKEFVYIQKNLDLWYRFDGKNFTFDSAATESSFKYKNLLKNKKFAEFFKWDASKKRYRYDSFFHAVNHSSKEECIGIRNENKKDIDSIDWICSV